MPELVLLDDDRRQFTALSRACVQWGSEFTGRDP